MNMIIVELRYNITLSYCDIFEVDPGQSFRGVDSAATCGSARAIGHGTCPGLRWSRPMEGLVLMGMIHIYG